MPLDPDRIFETSRKLRKFLKKAPKRPAPEQVHDFRTNIRRLEAAVHAFSTKPTHRERRILSDLRKIRRRAGKVRDMDVLTSDAASLQGAGDQDCEVQLLQHLGAHRYDYAQRLRAEIQQRGPRLRRRLKRLASGLAKRISAPGQKSAKGNPATSPDAVASAVELALSLKSPPSLNQENLHPYRLKVKELRDVLRLAEKPSDLKFIEILGQVKDAIGDWHDWHELTAIASDLLDHGSSSKLLQKLKEITDKKYERALALAVRMRKQFVPRGSKTPGAALIASTAMAS